VRHGLVRREARRDLPVCRAGAVELGDDAGDGLAGSQVPARGVTAGVPGDLLARLAAQVGVVAPVPGVHPAVEFEETLQGPPF
jgi:hypothetical protein